MTELKPRPFLKPCPFCGGDAEISQGRFDGKDTSYVMCRKCAAQGEFFFVSPKYSSNERAILAWNRRWVNGNDT